MIFSLNIPWPEANLPYCRVSQKFQRNTSHRGVVDNFAEFFQVFGCVDFIFVCDVVNLNQECSGQV